MRPTGARALRFLVAGTAAFTLMLPMGVSMQEPMAKAQTAFAIAQTGRLSGGITVSSVERRYPVVVELRGPQGQTRRFIYPSYLCSFGLLAALFIPAQGMGLRQKLIHCAAGSGLLLVAAFGEFYLAWGGAAAEWLLPSGSAQSWAAGWARLLSGFNLQFGPFVLPLAYWMVVSPFAWELAAGERHKAHPGMVCAASRDRRGALPHGKR